MSFIKRKEDFVCEGCGTAVVGNGYTNHCHNCLYSKHVDINPGDRLEACGGLMRPIYVSYTQNEEYVLHKCVRCGFERKNRIQPEDSIEAMSKIQSSSSI